MVAVPLKSTLSSSLPREQLKLVIVGHVDHGKSSLVGRIFYETGSLPEGKLEAIQKMCEKRGMKFEYSFLMDALQAERDQGITIDTAQIWFKTPKRDYVIIDAPGHKEFLKNMISGAASSEAALLIIDAKEGVKEQSKRHGYLLHLLGIKQIAVIVNKMDLVEYREEVFQKISQEYRAYLAAIGVTPHVMIPVSARAGDNITQRSEAMSWYQGPVLVEALDHFQPALPSRTQPLRFPVQDIYKFDERRIIAGRIETGTLRIGDELLFSPTNKTARVASIEQWGATFPLTEVYAGMSVAITLDEQLFIERGFIISHTKQPPILTNIAKARLFWLGQHPLHLGKRYKMKLTTSEWWVEIKAITAVISTHDLSITQKSYVEKGEVAEVTFTVKGVMAVDDFEQNHRMGRFVLLDEYLPVGGGILSLEGIKDLRTERTIKSTHVHEVDYLVSAQERARVNGHQGGVLWFSGLSGSGKTTIAKQLERRLFDKGYQVFVLDGDNIRTGLCADLGFSPQDRKENLRRIGHVAALLAEAGLIVITAFISPYEHDRQQARLAAPNMFHSIYIQADLATCEQRDPKGLYKKARAGEIQEFTGISAPFEEPENPDLIINTMKEGVEMCVERLVEYIEEQLGFASLTS